MRDYKLALSLITEAPGRVGRRHHKGKNRMTEREIEYLKADVTLHDTELDENIIEYLDVDLIKIPNCDITDVVPVEWLLRRARGNYFAESHIEAIETLIEMWRKDTE